MTLQNLILMTEVGVATPAPAAGAVAFVGRPVPGLTTQQIGLTYLQITNLTATAGSLALFPVTNIGTPNNTIVPVYAGGPEFAYGFFSSGGARADTGWAVAPTLAAVPYRATQLPATVGATETWTWPEDNPLLLAVGTVGFAVQNIGGVAASTLLVNARFALISTA